MTPKPRALFTLEINYFSTTFRSKKKNEEEEEKEKKNVFPAVAYGLLLFMYR